MEKELLNAINDDLKKLKEKQKQLQAESKTGSNLDEIQSKLDELAKITSKIQSRTNDKKKVENVVKLAKDGKAVSTDISDLYRKYKVDVKSVSKESTDKPATKENKNKSTKDEKAPAAPKKAAEPKKAEEKKEPAKEVKKPAGRNRGRGTKTNTIAASKATKEPVKELDVIEVKSTGRKVQELPKKSERKSADVPIVTLDETTWKATKKEKEENAALVEQVLDNLKDAGFKVEDKKEETPVIPKEIKVPEQEKATEPEKVLVAGGKLTKGQRPEFTEYEVDTSGWKIVVGKDITFEFKNGREGYKTDKKIFKEGFEMEQADIAAIIVEYCNYSNAELAHKLANKACNKGLIYAIAKLPITNGKKKDVLNAYLRDLDNPTDRPFVFYDLTEISRAATHGPDNMRSDQKYALAEIAEIAHQRGNAEIYGRFKVGALERVVNFFKGGRTRAKIASADILKARLEEDKASRRKKNSNYPDFASIKLDPEKIKRPSEQDSRLTFFDRKELEKTNSDPKMLVHKAGGGVEYISRDEWNSRVKKTTEELFGSVIEESKRRKAEADAARAEELEIAKKAWADAEKGSKEAKKKANKSKGKSEKSKED